MGENKPVGESIFERLLPAGQIILRLNAQDRDGAIEEMARSILVLKGKDAERMSFVSGVLDRERMHTTAAGDGVAFPHARNPQGALMSEAVLVFGRHERGIAFGAPDQKPVQLMFLLSAPGMTQHLHMLAVLSRVTRNPKVRQELLTAGTVTQVVTILSTAERSLTQPGR